MTEALIFDRVAAEGMDAMENVVTRLYVATHGDVIDNPFYSADRFVERVRGYAKAPGFELVVASVGGDPVGLALGYTLPRGARWWQALTTPIESAFVAENGTRTFALCEIMTHPGWQGKGVAHKVHDELLGKRPERRATLLVREGNAAARAAYYKWGWRQIGKMQPYPDSPHYDALILDLSEGR